MQVPLSNHSKTARVSSSSGERKSRRSVSGMFNKARFKRRTLHVPNLMQMSENNSFIAKSAMLFALALSCIPRKDRVNNRTDRP